MLGEWSGKKAIPRASTDCLYKLQKMKYCQVQYFHFDQIPKYIAFDIFIEKRFKECVDFKKFGVRWQDSSQGEDGD